METYKVVIPSEYNTVLFDQPCEWGDTLLNPTNLHDLTNIIAEHRFSYVGDIKIQYPSISLEIAPTYSMSGGEEITPITDDINKKGIINIFININQTLTNKYRFIRFILTFNDLNAQSKTPESPMLFGISLKVNEISLYTKTLTEIPVDKYINLNGTFTFVLDSETGKIIDMTSDDDYGFVLLSIQ